VAADPRSGAAEQLQKAAGPTTYELRKLGKTIKQWHPRATPKGRDVWSDDVSEYMRTAIPIIPARQYKDRFAAYLQPPPPGSSNPPAQPNGATMATVQPP